MNSEFAQEHLDVFSSAYLFRDLKPEELDSFVSNAQYSDYVPNSVIIREDDQGEYLYLILSGKVRVTKRTYERIEQILGILETGDFFGEMVLLDRRSRSASVYAHTRVELAKIQHSKVASILNENPRIGLKVLRAFSEVISIRLRNANDKLRSLPFIERSF
ncbi:MAG: cyclic nucleotide-binding domain-containing protein [Candidatus Aegiribacteria sp.]|nr:cyclic nucleotide-binding domain-containing protein [Candidatus Aegiribacteria sp.]